jgi:hypothetical protein
MNIQIQLNGNGQNAYLNELPDECPYCHDKIVPKFLYGIDDDGQYRWAKIIFLCPSSECKQVFISYYAVSEDRTIWRLLGNSVGYNKSKPFPKSINEISPNFVEIFNQAFSAEQYKLMQVCGVGYRKALEFLIKDFAKKKEKKENHEKIEALPLIKVIKTYIDHPKIKSNAERAVWLGNDETHYIRKWIDKDLKDLKILIDLTASYIDTEYLSDEFANEMKPS